MTNQIRMADVRRVVLEAMGIQYREGNYHKLPADFSTHPSFIRWNGYKVKVLSQAEAKEVSMTKARRPHRILIWCDRCSRWQFAGKLVQHQKFCKEESK